MAYPTSVTVSIDMTHGPYAGGFLFVDVSAYVTGRVTYEWGRSNAVDDFQPARGSLTLDNSDGRFDPSNTSGPYYGNLKPRRRIRIQTVVASVTYTIAWGYIEGWPQRWEGRNKCYVDITFTDAMALFAQIKMPDSVWDYRALERTPMMWYKLGDTQTPKASDSSGHNLTGEWRVFEGVGSPVAGNYMPAPIRAAGNTGSVIPSTKRQAVSWAALQVGTGQPLGGIAGTPRTPVFVPAWDTQNLPNGDFTAAAWVHYRQAFPINVTTAYASTTPMDEPLFTWGQPGGHYWSCVLNTDGLIDWFFSNDGVTTLGIVPLGTSIDDGLPHHVGIVKSGNIVQTYVDSVSKYTVNISTVLPAPIVPCVVGYASSLPTGQQSTIGDVTFWNRALSTGDMQSLWYAGKYGSTTVGVAALDTTNAFLQGFTMAGVSSGIGAAIFVQTGNLVAETISGQTFAEYLHKLAASEQGLLFANRDGTIVFYGRRWQLETHSATSQYTLGDQVGATLGYSQMNFRDASTEIQNDVTVNYPGGSVRAINAASVTDYGTASGTVDTFIQDPAFAQQVANFRVWKYGTPATNGLVPDSIVVEPNTTAEFTMVCALTIADRLTITRTRPNGTTIVDDYWAQSIRQQFDASQGGPWQTTIGLMPASEPANPFILDASLLDSADVLWI